jgi:hypothetical protein
MPLRPQTHVAKVLHTYGNFWKAVDLLRSPELRPRWPEWPEWCFLPVHVTQEILPAYFPDEKDDEDRKKEAPLLSGLAAWRVTQGIYRFAPEVLDAIWDTPIEGQIPSELLYRLPEWCVYVETPGKALGERALEGFFAYLDGSAGHSLIVFLLDWQCGCLDNLPIILQGDGLEATVRCLSSTNEWSHEQKEKALDEMRAYAAPLLSLVLYLCSTAAEIHDADGSPRQPEHPRPIRTKKGPRIFPPDRSTTWEVAYRLGAALRLSLAQFSEAHGGTHASPRPHIRRAHWHSFWTGPHDQPARRRLELRWLPPVPVAATDPEQLVPAIHVVPGPQAPLGRILRISDE